ncbi:MAG TPA: hypothetical protein O0X14_02940, partial [Methanocorpusculum sp.]|nr:hypothetical protein [Methanocorpusculum sp.]
VISRNFSINLSNNPLISIKQMDVSNVDDEQLICIIQKHDFVIVALSDHIQNDRITKLALHCNVWVNCATNNESNFLIPSTSKGKEYTISVSTSGVAPVISKFIHEDLDARYQGLDSVIGVISDLRTKLKSEVQDPKLRMDILRSVIRDKRIWNRCRDNLDVSDIIGEYIHEK